MSFFGGVNYYDYGTCGNLKDLSTQFIKATVFILYIKDLITFLYKIIVILWCCKLWVK